MPIPPTRPAAETLTRALAASLGEPAAVAWVQTTAVISHAIRSGLIDDTLDRPGDAPSTIRAAAAQLAGVHPALGAFADPAVAPIWDQRPPLGHVSELLSQARRGHLIAPSPALDTVALGDLYERLSSQARKVRALVQTPRFVAVLLLELSYDHAFSEWGPATRIIDPACGTGHLLVAAYQRAVGKMVARREGLARADAAVRALQAVHGVDLDRYAVAIARYRLLAAACQRLGVRLAAAPCEAPIQIAAADALLASREPLLQRGRYHAVVANPPYIACADPVAREAIRARYRTVCSGRYPLSVPFEVLMHELCVPGGWVARLTSSAFMKREFGRKLVEDYFPTIDLQWVIDTSGAYIHGHGTPTVILVSRNQPPSSGRVKA